jgi:tetratricopeptide (TPR) repeat protein
MPKRSRNKKAGEKASDAAQASAAGESRSKVAWWSAALLATIITVVYGRAVDVPFIFDDFNSIQTNETIVSLWPLWSAEPPFGPLNTPRSAPTTSRPIVNLSFALNYWFGELNPTGYRWVNIALHICSAVLLAAIVRRTLKLPYFEGRFDGTAEWLALAAALLWALHPLQTESVICATQRTELMMAFFYLGTLYCSLRYWTARTNERQTLQPKSERGIGRLLYVSSASWLILATLSCLAGMGSKEVMVSAPLMVLLFERTFVAGSLAKALRQSWPLYCGLAGGWLLLLWLHAGTPHHESAGFQLGVSGPQWWLTQTKVLLMYLKLVFWPWPLLIHYDMPYLDSFAKSWMYVIPVALLGLGTLYLLWRNHPVGYLGTAAFAILSPTLVIPIPTEVAAERRMYLALAAIVAIVVVGGYCLMLRLAERTNARRAASYPQTAIWTMVVLTLVVGAVFTAVSMRRLLAYENELILWQEVVHHQPHDYMGHLNMGVQLFNAGNVTEAMSRYREALRLRPDSSQVHYNVGLALMQLNKPREAVDEFREAVRLHPPSSRLTNNLGVALFTAGQYDEAIEAFRDTIEIEPDMWRAHDNLGNALTRVGRYAEAIDCFTRALSLNPLALDVHGRLANAQAKADQPAAAIATVEKALQLAQEHGDMATAEKLQARLAEYRAQQIKASFKGFNPSAENIPPSN